MSLSILKSSWSQDPQGPLDLWDPEDPGATHGLEDVSTSCSQDPEEPLDPWGS